MVLPNPTIPTIAMTETFSSLLGSSKSFMMAFLSSSLPMTSLLGKHGVENSSRRNRDQHTLSNG